MGPVASQPHGEQADVAVTEFQDVLGEFAHGPAIVDADARDPWHVLRLVDHHHRQLTLLQHRQIRIVVGRRVDHEPVDTRREHGIGPLFEGAVGPDGDQQQALPGFLTRFGKTGNEIECGGIAERIVERFGDHETDRTGLAGAQ